MSAATVPAPTPLWDRVRGYTPAAALPADASRRSPCSSGCSASAASATRALADPQVLLSLLIDNAFLIVLAVGMTFVILTGGIDLSVGSVVALSTMIAAKTLRDGLVAVPLDGGRAR